MYISKPEIKIPKDCSPKYLVPKSLENGAKKSFNLYLKSLYKRWRI